MKGKRNVKGAQQGITWQFTIELISLSQYNFQKNLEIFSSLSPLIVFASFTSAFQLVNERTLIYFNLNLYSFLFRIKKGKNAFYLFYN